jgi:cob(I)alamin adenosyltransferase
MAVYTKKGDLGVTSLYAQKYRSKLIISKDSVETRALGSLDELNCYIGVVRSESGSATLNKILINVQNNLLTIGSIIAGSRLRFFSSHTKKLEQIIDNLEAKMPALSTFIIPGGTNTSAKLHFVRALTRRAERDIVAFHKKHGVKPSILSYINRLSDTFFVLARWENISLKIADDIWKNK